MKITRPTAIKKDSVAFWSIAVIVFVALLLRYRSSTGDLWLDEIWSLHMVLGMQSAFDIISSIHHDNNHYLNTFICYLLGDAVPGIYYRIPSFIAGAGTVFIASQYINCKNNIEKIVTAFIFCFSYWMIHYSSEARGYSYLNFFILLSIVFFKEYLKVPSQKTLILFSAAVIFGFLSHLTFIHLYAAFVIWAIASWHQQKKDTDLIIKNSLILFGPSAAFFLALYVIDLRFTPLGVGVGDKQPLIPSIFETIAWTVSGQDDSFAIAISLILFLLVSLHCAKKFALEKNSEGAFYLWATLISPATFVIILQPSLLYPRYFVASSTLFLLLLAQSIAYWIKVGGMTRVAATAVACVLLVMNVDATLGLWKMGRGNYSQALQKIVKDSRDTKSSIGSDQDFRNSMLIAYHSRQFSSSPPISYYPIGSWTNTEPEWVIHHQFDPMIAPLSEIDGEKQGHFKLEAFYPSVKLSGFSWALYHRVH